MNFDRLYIDLFRLSKELFKKYNVMSTRYTKSDLEKIVSVQSKIIIKMKDLISALKHQNQLLNGANKKIKDVINDFKQNII